MSDEYQRAVALMNEGDLAQAHRLLEDAIAQHDGEVHLRLALGVCLILMSEPRAAEEQLRMVAAAEPKNASAWYHLGASLQAQGRAGEAADAYGRALQIEDHADARERLAQCDGGVRETLRPHWRHLSPPAIVVTLFTAGVICTGQTSSLISPLDVLLPVGLIAYCGFAWAVVAFKARRTQYLIYERRLEISPPGMSIWFFEITGVRAVRGPLSTLTRTASVEVDYGADFTARLEGIGDPVAAHRIARLVSSAHPPA